MFIHSAYCKWEFLVPCSNSTVCLLAQACLEELIICFRSLVFAECDGLRGMPTSTKASLQPTGQEKELTTTLLCSKELSEGMITVTENLLFLLTGLYSGIAIWSRLSSQDVQVKMHRKGVSIHIYSGHTKDLLSSNIYFK